MKIVQLDEEINDTQAEINAIFNRVTSLNSELDQLRAELNLVVAEKKRLGRRSKNAAPNYLDIKKE